MAVVLLVAGACGHPHSPSGEDLRKLRVENQRLEEENRVLKENTADLQKLVDEERVRGALARMTSDRELYLRARLGPARTVVPVLDSIIRTEQGGLRRRAVFAAGEYGVEARVAVTSLQPLLESEDPRLQRLAALAVARIAPRTPGCTTTLLAAMANEKDTVERWYVWRALDEIRPRVRDQLHDVLLAGTPDLRLEAFRQLTVVRDADTAHVDRLRKGLVNRDETVRVFHAILLARAAPGTPGLLDLVIEGLRSRHTVVRSEAIAALKALNSRERKVVVGLLPLLEDQDFSVAIDAAALLGHLRSWPEKSVPALARVVKGHDTPARATAAYALAAFPDRAETVVPVLRAALRERHFWRISPRDPGRTVRGHAWAASALGSMGAAAAPAVPDLIAALEDPGCIIQVEVVAALGRIGPAARTALPALEERRRNNFPGAAEAIKSIRSD